MLADLDGVDAAIAAVPEEHDVARTLVWPTTALFTVSAARPVAALQAAERAGYREAAVVVSDVPDVPGLLIAKLFRGLGSHSVAAAPASDGGLFALATGLPVPTWLVAADPELGDADVTSLREASGQSRMVARTLGWRRLRQPADIGTLDPGLEGWDTTRALLSGGR